MGRRLSGMRRWQEWGIILLLATVAAGPLLFHAGFLNTRGGGDSPFLLFRLQQLTTALRDSQFPVRWMPDAAYGLGYPFFSYYAALPYYIASLLVLWGFALVAALKITQWLGFVLAAWAAWGWVRHTTGNRWAAWLAAGAFTFAPYHLINVYVRGDALSEFWAMGLYPLVLWLAVRVSERTDRKRLVQFGLGYAALILTHNVSALIFSPFLLLYLALLAVEKGHRTKDWSIKNWGMIGGVLLGFLLAAFFWLPALGEQDAVQLNAQTSGYFHFSNHFRPLAPGPSSLIQTSSQFNYDIAGQTPFSMGIWQAVFTAAGVLFSLYYLYPRKKGKSVRASNKPSSRNLVWFSLFTLVISTLMMLPASTPLWESIPMLPMVQFPWRFLSIQALACALLIGMMGEWGNGKNGKSQINKSQIGKCANLRMGELANGGVEKSTNLKSQIGESEIEASQIEKSETREPTDHESRINRPSERRVGLSNFLISLGRLAAVAVVVVMGASALGGLKPDFIALSDADVTPARLQLYEWFSGNIGTTIRYEYLPKTVVPRLDTSEGVISGGMMAANVLSGKASTELLEKRTGREAWNVDVQSESAVVAFPTLYWPGWRARVDGKRANFEPVTSLGKMTLNLPAGRHLVELSLGRTPLRLAAELISAITLLACLLSLAIKAFFLRIVAIKRQITLAAIGVLIVMVIVGLILHQQPIKTAELNDLTWDFDQQAYLHPNPDGVTFKNGAVLQDYVYGSPEDGSLVQPLPGQVTIRWTMIPRDELTAELALVHPAEVVLQVPYTLSSVREPITGWETTFNLPPLESATPGPLLVRLRLFDSGGEPVPAYTSSGNWRGDLYLRPVWVGAASPAAGTKGIRLDRVSTDQSGPEHLQVNLQWVVGNRVPANYQAALRLYGEDGQEWAALDAQPGYGFYPTGAWQPDTLFTDHLLMDIPYGAPPGSYRLSVSLYDVATLEPAWGPEEYPVTLDTFAPNDRRPAAHPFTSTLAATALDAPDTITQGDPFSFSVLWATTGALDSPLTLEWELAGENNDILDKTEPLGQWPANSMVLGRYNSPLDPLTPPGEYRLNLSIVDTATGAMVGESWQAARIQVEEQPRSFGLPEMDAKLGAEYGQLIRLEGYSLEKTGQQLSLDLVWKALAEIPQDYTVFVHLYDPTTETIVAQCDAMPKSNTYPTSRWAPGEIVVDPVMISLAGVPAGSYRLAVGLYTKSGNEFIRLPVVDSNGSPLPGDRLTLPGIVETP